MRKAAATTSVASIANLAHRFTLLNASVPDRKHGVWLGGSILGSLSSHHEIWLSKAEYYEHGASIACRKGMQYAW